MKLSPSLRALRVASLAVALCGVVAQAQDMPKTLRIVVAQPAGEVGDVVARALAGQLGAQLGIKVAVENKAGARGTVGMNAIAKAAPDGATLGFAAVDPLVLNPLLLGKPPFDPLKDIAPVAGVMYSPVLLLATQATGTRDFRTLLDDARARPGAVRWATAGQVSLGRIVLEQLCVAAKVNIMHIPYRGGIQQMSDALGGHFEILSAQASPGIMPHVRSGKLRPLAVGAPARLESLPKVPTLGELGFPEANLAVLFGVFAPAATSPLLIAKYNLEINRALESPEVRARIASLDHVPMGGRTSAFADEIAAEYRSNARIMKAAGIRED